MANVWAVIGKALSGGASGLITGLGDTIDKFVTTKEEKELLKQAMTKLVQDHDMALKQMSLEVFKAEVADRDSARNRELEIAKTDKNDWLMKASGVVALVSFVSMLLAIIFDKTLGLGISEQPIFHQLMGIVEGVALTVFAYYFGTSKSSADKTKHLADRANQNTTT
jgi:hypothetical protein